MKIPRPLFVLPMLASIACALEPPVNSTDIATSDLAFNMTLQGTPASTHLSISAFGPGPRVRLVEGDALRLETPIGTIPLAIDGHGVGLDLPPVGGSFELVLTRPPGRGDGIRQSFYLAPPFALRPPVTASRAQSVTFSWDRADGPHGVTISVGGECLAPITRSLSFDVGTYTFNPYELASSAAKPGTCKGTVQITKATLPLTYFSAVQTTRAEFESTP